LQESSLYCKITHFGYVQSKKEMRGEGEDEDEGFTRRDQQSKKKEGGPRRVALCGVEV
jgi:hypothetical protein